MREGTYIVQLGAFSSASKADRAWSYYTGKYGALSGFDHVSTPVTSKGRTLHRLSAVGFGNRQTALAMCDGLKARGGSCIVRKAGKSVAGTKLAMRR
ncbi:MAG: SPOR domain-containing protein [Pseudomonadota bacterium]